MRTGKSKVQRINEFIQSKLKKLKRESVTPVEATRWLIKAGILKKLEPRPGSYLRQYCRVGKILGAKKKNKFWIIKRIKKRK